MGRNPARPPAWRSLRSRGPEPGAGFGESLVWGWVGLGISPVPVDGVPRDRVLAGVGVPPFLEDVGRRSSAREGERRWRLHELRLSVDEHVGPARWSGSRPRSRRWPVTSPRRRAASPADRGVRSSRRVGKHWECLSAAHWLSWKCGMSSAHRAGACAGAGGRWRSCR